MQHVGLDDLLDINLSKGQLDKLANLYVGLANLSSGMSVIPALIQPTDTPGIVLVGRNHAWNRSCRYQFSTCSKPMNILRLFYIALALVAIAGAVVAHGILNGKNNKSR